MIISEVKYAAAIVDEAGMATSFDDVGCLLSYLEASPVGDRQIWVQDHDGSGWIEAERAWFVRGSRESTPMGSGLTAFAARAKADIATEDPAGVGGWEALRGR